MDGYLPVKVDIPLDLYRRLNAVAETRGITVSEVIVRRLTSKRPSHNPHGRPSAYTSNAGEEIAAARRFHMSWPDIERRLGISSKTARDWLSRYENEVRVQNLQDHEERKSR